MYADQAHTFKRDVVRDFSKCMKAYLFLSSHLKFEVEIPLNLSFKHPSKNPNSIQAEGNDYLSSNENEPSPPDQSFVIHPPSKSRTAHREVAKRGDAVNFIIDQVSKQTSEHQFTPSH